MASQIHATSIVEKTLRAYFLFEKLFSSLKAGT